MALTSFNASHPCELVVYRERACSETGSLSSSKLSANDNPFEHEGKPLTWGFYLDFSCQFCIELVPRFFHFKRSR